MRGCEARLSLFRSFTYNPCAEELQNSREIWCLHQHCLHITPMLYILIAKINFVTSSTSTPLTKGRRSTRTQNKRDWTHTALHRKLSNCLHATEITWIIIHHQEEFASMCCSLLASMLFWFLCLLSCQQRNQVYDCFPHDLPASSGLLTWRSDLLPLDQPRLWWLLLRRCWHRYWHQKGHCWEYEAFPVVVYRGCQTEVRWQISALCQDKVCPELLMSVFSDGFAFWVCGILLLSPDYSKKRNTTCMLLSEVNYDVEG